MKDEKNHNIEQIFYLYLTFWLTNAIFAIINYSLQLSS